MHQQCQLRLPPHDHIVATTIPQRGQAIGVVIAYSYFLRQFSVYKTCMPTLKVFYYVPKSHSASFVSLLSFSLCKMVCCLELFS